MIEDDIYMTRGPFEGTRDFHPLTLRATDFITYLVGHLAPLFAKYSRNVLVFKRVNRTFKFCIDEAMIYSLTLCATDTLAPFTSLSDL